MAIPAVGGVGQLAQLYRQQMLSGANGTTGADAAQAASGATATTGAGATDPAAAARGNDFAGAIGRGLQSLEGLDRTASTKAVQAATGDLHDVQDYVIAATQAQVATELTTTVRNKALDAFNEIMRMPL